MVAGQPVTNDNRHAREADDRAGKLERSVELRETLIRGVTHDIKNPLGAVAGYAELLEDGIAGAIKTVDDYSAAAMQQRLTLTVEDDGPGVRGSIPRSHFR